MTAFPPHPHARAIIGRHARQLARMAAVGVRGRSGLGPRRGRGRGRGVGGGRGRWSRAAVVEILRAGRRRARQGGTGGRRAPLSSHSAAADAGMDATSQSFPGTLLLGKSTDTLILYTLHHTTTSMPPYHTYIGGSPH